MAKTKSILNSKLVDFPEEIDEQNGVRIYGETSYENQMAVLSQFFHNEHKSIETKAEIASCIRQFLARKKFRQNTEEEELTDEEIWNVAESPAQQYLFADFFEVPFPEPAKPKFTFIDLFSEAGTSRGMATSGLGCIL